MEGTVLTSSNSDTPDIANFLLDTNREVTPSTTQKQELSSKWQGLQDILGYEVNEMKVQKGGSGPWWSLPFLSPLKLFGIEQCLGTNKLHGVQS